MTDESRGRIRRARKQHRCDQELHHRIQPGELYREATLFPGHDCIAVDRPVRLRACRPCAERFGHVFPKGA